VETVLSSSSRTMLATPTSLLLTAIRLTPAKPCLCYQGTLYSAHDPCRENVGLRTTIFAEAEVPYQQC